MLRVDRRPYLTRSNQAVPAGTHDTTITLHPRPRVSGSVTDAETGELIESFTLTPGEATQSDRFHWQTSRSIKATNGQFEEELQIPFHPSYPMVLRAEAEGYVPAVSESFAVTDENVERHFNLQRSVPITGIIRGPDGEPVEGAEVYLTLGRAAFDPGNVNQLLKAIPDSDKLVTGPDGTYSFKPREQPFGIGVIAEEGFARRWPAELAESTVVELVPWGRIEGRYFIGDQPQADVKIRVNIDGVTGPALGWSYYLYESTTDAEGRFVIERVTPGFANAFTSKSSPYPFEVLPGETVEIKIGGSGRPLVGRVEVPGDVSLPIGLDRTSGGLSQPLPPRPGPEVTAGLSEEEQIAFFADWYQTPEGRAWKLAYRGHVVRVAADGSFRVEDVEPGVYQLKLKLTDREPGVRTTIDRTEILATLEQEVTVPEGGEPLDLGTFPLDVRTVERKALLEVGQEAPAFEIESLDGEPLKLADFRGKYVLLDFWATWCGPCLAEEPHLQATWEAFGDDDRFMMIALSLDEDPKAPQAHVKARETPWLQGFLGPWPDSEVAQDFGILSIPQILLVGPDGRVVAINLRGEQIKQALAEALAKD